MPRYSLKMLLLLATAACFVAALLRFHPPIALPILLCWGALAIGFLAPWAWGRRLPVPAPEGMPMLLALQAAVAIMLLAAPIAPYLINGRGWYDLGLSTYNPPPYLTDNGPLRGIDYDPGNTRPFAWSPTIGSVWHAASFAALFLAPIAAAISIGAAVELVRMRHGGQSQDRARAWWWILWTLTAIPITFTTAMEPQILGWLFD